MPLLTELAAAIGSRLLPPPAWVPTYTLRFPEGICGFLAGSGYHPSAYNTIFIIDWVFSAGLTLCCVLGWRRAKYFMLYSILCAVLILNIVVLCVAFQQNQ
jgi:hypothetical protein